MAAALVFGVLAAGLGAAYVLQRSPRFESRSVMIIDQPILIARSGSGGILVKLDALRSKYSILAGTRRIAEPVAARLKLPVTTVARAVTMGVPRRSLVLIVTARTPSRTMSQHIADEMSTELVNFVKAEQDAAKIPDTTRIVLTVVSPAQPGQKVEPTRQRATAVGVTAGIIAAIAVLVLVQLIRVSREPR